MNQTAVLGASTRAGCARDYRRQNEPLHRHEQEVHGLPLGAHRRSMGPRARLEKIRGARYKGKHHYHRAHDDDAIDDCVRVVGVARRVKQILENRKQARQAGDYDGVRCKDDKKRRHSCNVTEQNCAIHCIQLLVSNDTFSRSLISTGIFETATSRLCARRPCAPSRSGLGCNWQRGGGEISVLLRNPGTHKLPCVKHFKHKWCRRQFTRFLQ